MSHSHANHLIDHHLPEEKDIKELIYRVHKVCPFGSTNKFNSEKILTRHALSLFSFAEIKKSTKEETHKEWKLFGEKYQKDIQTYQHYLAQKTQPVSTKTRKQFLLGLSAFTKSMAYNYGYGNCEALTEVAFLEAVMMNFRSGIHYVRFDNSDDPSKEELNAIVLGEWPHRGCVIVSPWSGALGQQFLWEGSCERTAILAEEKYNRPRSIFSITHEDLHREKQFIKHSLINAYYNANWLASERRARLFMTIKNNFLNQVHRSDLLTSKTSLNYSTYTEWVMFGCTAKTNLKKLEAIQNSLQEEKAVINIANMPRN